MPDQVKALLPPEAWKIIQSDQRSVLIDVRSSMEYLFVGHPMGSVHVPWIDAPEWTVNPQFVTEVRKVLLGGVGMGVHESDVAGEDGGQFLADGQA